MSTIALFQKTAASKRLAGFLIQTASRTRWANDSFLPIFPLKASPPRDTRLSWAQKVLFEPPPPTKKKETARKKVLFGTPPETQLTRTKVLLENPPQQQQITRTKATFGNPIKNKGNQLGSPVWRGGSALENISETAFPPRRFPRLRARRVHRNGSTTGTAPVSSGGENEKILGASALKRPFNVKAPGKNENSSSSDEFLFKTLREDNHI